MIEADALFVGRAFEAVDCLMAAAAAAEHIETGPCDAGLMGKAADMPYSRNCVRERDSAMAAVVACVGTDWSTKSPRT